MKIHRLDAKTVALEEIDGLIAELLRQIPASADPTGSDAATQRLFPTLTEGRDPEADADWREYVEPGLRELFLDAVSVVRDDLRNFPGKTQASQDMLRVPVKHLDAWVHTLNQARLALAARHDFSEGELESEIPAEGGERAFVLFQLHFYGLLQEFLLRQSD